MICKGCSKDLSSFNRKGVTNHTRWCTGLMEEARARMSASKLASRNPMWKGDKVGYISLHEWVAKRMNTDKVCSTCGSEKSVDLANISGRYSRELSDWKWLCRSCHMKEDGRINNLKQYEGANHA